MWCRDDNKTPLIEIKVLQGQEECPPEYIKVTSCYLLVCWCLMAMCRVAQGQTRWVITYMTECAGLFLCVLCVGCGGCGGRCIDTQGCSFEQFEQRSVFVL